MNVTVRYFAAARAASGTDSELVDATPQTTVGQLVRQLAADHGEKLADVLERCSFLVDGVACADGLAVVTPDGTVDVLPPFAGG